MEILTSTWYKDEKISIDEMSNFILDCKERWLPESCDLTVEYMTEYLEYLKELDCCTNLSELALVLNHYSDFLDTWGEWYIKNI